MTRSPLTLLDWACLALAAFLLWNVPHLLSMYADGNRVPDVCHEFYEHGVACR